MTAQQNQGRSHQHSPSQEEHLGLERRKWSKVKNRLYLTNNNLPSSGVRTTSGTDAGPEPMVKADISIWYA